MTIFTFGRNIYIHDYGFMSFVRSETGRQSIAYAVVGTFDGTNFTGLFEKEFDFGTSAYAFQVLARHIAYIKAYMPW